MLKASINNVLQHIDNHVNQYGKLVDGYQEGSTRAILDVPGKVRNVSHMFHPSARLTSDVPSLNLLLHTQAKHDTSLAFAAGYLVCMIGLADPTLMKHLAFYGQVEPDGRVHRQHGQMFDLVSLVSVRKVHTSRQEMDLVMVVFIAQDLQEVIQPQFDDANNLEMAEKVRFVYVRNLEDVVRGVLHLKELYANGGGNLAYALREFCPVMPGEVVGPRK